MTHASSSLIYRQNMAKVLLAMQHIMSLDPCRRFVFGITIDNAEMRLWYCNRSWLAVTEPIDIIKVNKPFRGFFICYSDQLV